MTSRPAVIAAIIGVTALSGCATFTDTDVVATFNDVTLDTSEFDERYDSSGAARFDGRVLGDPARGVITSWVLQQVLVEAGLIDFYDRGPEASNILCASLLPTASLAEADDYVERFEAGENWSDVVTAEFPDVISDGNVDCLPTDSLGPLAPQLAGLSPDDPYSVFLFDDQRSAVLRIRNADQIDPIELASIAQAIAPDSVAGLDEAIDDADITIAPKYGRFEAEAGGVVPLD